MGFKEAKIYLGINPVMSNENSIDGSFVQLDGEEYYKISNCEKMNPFLISLVSSSDHWMYISSTGGITAGRKNSDNALFPYYTDDKIHDSSETTGSKTVIRVRKGEKVFLWQPFSQNSLLSYKISRNLYKNVAGTELIFEEVNHSLECAFRYSWTSGERFGFIKHSKLINNSDSDLGFNILDGIVNILPAGVNYFLQNEYSTLLDGYKKCELLPDEHIGIFSLSSLLSDRPEPSESLSATTVWSSGLSIAKVLLCERQINDFAVSGSINSETDVKGVRGAYLVNSDIKLGRGESRNWFIVSEINQEIGDVLSLQRLINSGKNLTNEITSDVESNKTTLEKYIAKADGLQKTNHKLNTTRHHANVLFNIARGGIFPESYSIDKNDFNLFLRANNPFVLKTHEAFLNKLPNKIKREELVSEVNKLGDSHFTKLTLEYLPLTFSRRHGDPSRPWNKFSIDIKDGSGREILNYQGNWRDIFQNWEALCMSFPGYIESAIAKFVNTSTADGYNPYRITRDGFDWENQEPDNPWANIGYWGDHQIIYLAKLLELSADFHPSQLDEFLSREIFSYANVPYRIKTFDELVSDPFNSIEFDFELDMKLRDGEKKYGADSKFLKYSDGTLVMVNLAEKLFVPLLAKISNFVFGGGIWMNTQRPEWNDANNAIVGNGISMVTTYYIRRYLMFLKKMIENSSANSFGFSNEVADYLEQTLSVLKKYSGKVKEINDSLRFQLLKELGTIGSVYRSGIYKNGFSGGKRQVPLSSISDFISTAIKLIDETIHLNEREDGLFHSYNIMNLRDDELSVSNLYEMLEGQVAVLSSGYLSANQSIELLESLRSSKLYRADQNSYMLYPDRELPLFVNKNAIPPAAIDKSPLFRKLEEIQNTEIIKKDEEGNYHFHRDLRNAQILKQKLAELTDPELKSLARDELPVILEIYEKTFNHREFTGRSGTFYKYEGLGSIYWHMVSKLLLAVQEIYFAADRDSADGAILAKLKSFYYDIKAGIGVEKQPDKYGAFPTDPYSHTPSFAGVQQPGMTGQVKEDVISRTRELGFIVNAGKIVFDFSLLKRNEFLSEQETFEYYDIQDNLRSIVVPEGALAYTVCQIPIVVALADSDSVEVTFSDGSGKKFEGLELDETTSRKIFKRDGEISSIEVRTSLVLD